MSVKLVCTRAEVTKEIYKQRKLKKVGYCVFVHPFLPTKDDRGFNGCTLVRVTRKDFIAAVNDLMDIFEERGAKLELTVPTQDYESFIIG